MSSSTRLATIAVPLLVGMAIAGAAAGSGKAEAGATATSGPMTCEIQKKVSGGMVQLLGVVKADVPLSGSYTFAIASSGGGNSSNINQGGPFAADAKRATTLGTVMLGANSAYKATLTVMANGVTVACSDPVATAL